MAIDPAATVRAIVLFLFRKDFPLRRERLPVLESNRAWIYDILTWVLPSLTSTNEFWCWVIPPTGTTKDRADREAVDRFYNHKNIGILGPRNGHNSLGWVTRREVEEALTGIYTYANLALMSGG
ncbi:hypothetical protein K443DRAFT_630706 [Laccaria amethystina LaAM-08-1]|uniref:Uncharacterized protein n=1 Tax=Laccaria amethystina LaAM-08-1 TaxID=1095629 RepID=A0A0C9XNW7_9AGAR|nr:hypothetical protein K443DRAFT_630706 [Laccaria amethystina LaAM-08-1]